MNLSGLAALGLAANRSLQEGAPWRLGASSETIATTSSATMQANDNLGMSPHWIVEGGNLSSANTSTRLGQLVALATTATAAVASQQQAPLQFQLQQQQQQQQQQQHHQTELQLQQQQQQSFADWWQEYWSRQPFPSGYTQSSITLVACLLTTFIFLIVVGNLLVCIAIFTEKSLKPTQNWFIASLAVSDMLLGLVVMPFSLARELMGFWVFGPLWCDIHEALDVLLTTASINTLCLISLDRYWSITQAVNYLKKRTPRRAVFMIAFVWVFSAAVSLPPLIGWKKQTGPSVNAPPSNATKQQRQQQQQRLPPVRAEPQETRAITSEPLDETTEFGEPPGAVDQLDQEGQRRDWRRKRREKSPSQEQNRRGFVPSRSEQHTNEEFHSIPALIAAANRQHHHQQQQQLQPVINYAYLSSGEQQQQLQQQQQLDQQLANEYPTCQLSDDIGYVLYSALGSFYIPCAVMVFTYIKIGLAARKRARRAINKQARAQAAGGQLKKGGAAGAGGRGRTLTGTTSGRTSKQMPTGDSTLLLSSSAVSESQANQRRFSAAAGAHRRRNSRPGSKLSELHPQQQQPQHQDDGRRESLGPLVMGKPVVVGRQKAPTSAVQVAPSVSAAQTDQMQVSSSIVVAAQSSNAADTCCAATLTTSGSKLASPSALKYSGDAGRTQREGADEKQPEAQPDAKGQRAEGRKRPARESNDSSLITVISASMQELPQVTRFNFAPGQRQPEEAAGKQEEQEDKAAALLRVISQAADEDGDEREQVGELPTSATATTTTTTTTTSNNNSNNNSNSNNNELQREREQQASNNSTNETCFMTIEEDSDNLESQTGRTIMMIASTAKQSSSSLANKSRAGMMMTMMPAGATPGGQQTNDSSPVACNNVACLRRRARRRARRLRRDPSYCGSSATLDDDEDDDGEDDVEEHDDDDEDDEGEGEEEDDEEEDEDDEDEDEEEDDNEMMGNSLDSDEGENCHEDELELTDECNGYSGGSCRAYCTVTVSSTCEHCRECAALSTGTQAASSGECLEDSPLSCEVYNYLRCSPPESPVSSARGRPDKCQQAERRPTKTRRANQRRRHAGSSQATCQHKQHSPLAVQRKQHGGQQRQQQRQPRQLQQSESQQRQQQQQQQFLSCNVSEVEAQSLTGDDNLSLTDYYRSNEDNSSIMGLDVLDATPARERLGPKRKSIVAAAIATVGGGFNRMASAATMQHHNHPPDQAEEAAAAAGAAPQSHPSGAGRKKSSIGFHFGRFATSGSGQAETGGANQAGGGGVLLALAAASQQQNQQQQQQLQAAGSNATRNLKTLRQNFFHKLNQLTAKSALRQANSGGKQGQSSAPSSYGSSYEPSIDYATTSNMHSTNDQYQAEATFAETDDYEQRNSETTKQSSEQISPGLGPSASADGRRRSNSAGKTAGSGQQQHHLQQALASRASDQASGQPVISADGVQQEADKLAQDDQSGLGQARQAGSNSLAAGAERGGDGQLLTVNDEKLFARAAQGDDMGRLPAVKHAKARPGQLKRRSADKSDTTTMALVCPDQDRIGQQKKPSGTNAIARQGASGANSSGGGSSNVIGKTFLASDNERHKRKLAKARERRATLILGLIMATFVSCWFPFFSFYVLRAVCHVCRDYIPPRLEAFIFWMGYCNSACNPIIYTIFNRDFRKAFRKILFRCSRD